MHTSVRVFCFFILIFCLPWISTKALAVALEEQEYEQLIQELTQLLVHKKTQGFTYFSVQASPDGYTLKMQPASLGYVRIKPEALGIKNGDEVNVIQASHQFFDKHTKPIAQALFTHSESDVLMLNTTQRYASESADLTHIEHSLFTAVAQVIKAQNALGKVIQIHGYDEEKRATKEAQQADIILSNGTAFAYPYMQKIQTCFRDVGQLLVRIYGRDVFELGGVQNQVGKVLRDRNKLHFLHIEVSQRLRLQWNDNNMPEALIQCVLQTS